MVYGCWTCFDSLSHSLPLYEVPLLLLLARVCALYPRRLRTRSVAALPLRLCTMKSLALPGNHSHIT